MYKRASLNQKFSRGHFKLASAIMYKHAGSVPALSLGTFGGEGLSGLGSGSLTKAIGEAFKNKGPLEGMGSRAVDMVDDLNIAPHYEDFASVPKLQLGELFGTMDTPRDLGLAAGAAGLAGLGSAKMLNNIKALQRKDPSFFGRLMGKKPTGFTRNQLNALGSALGLGAGAGIYGAGLRTPHVLDALNSMRPSQFAKEYSEAMADVGMAGM